MCMCVYVDVSLWMSLNEVKCIHGFAEFELAITDGEESSKFQSHETPFMASPHLISQEDRDTQRTDPQRTERTERRGTSAMLAFAPPRWSTAPTPRRLESFR